MATVEPRQASIDSLERVLSYLVKERQTLRSSGAAATELEANRLAIVAMQLQLTRAIGEEHASPLNVGST